VAATILESAEYNDFFLLESACEMIVEIAESRLDANLMKLVDNQVDYARNEIATSDAELDFYKDPTYLR